MSRWGVLGKIFWIETLHPKERFIKSLEVNKTYKAQSKQLANLKVTRPQVKVVWTEMNAGKKKLSDLQTNCQFFRDLQEFQL